MSWLKSFLMDDDAPTFLEYGLLITAIALAVIAAATVFGASVMDLFVKAAGAP